MKLFKYWSIVAVILLGMASCDDDEVEIVSKVSFKEATVSAYEGEGKLRVPIEISSPLPGNAWISASIVEGSAQGGEEGINYRVPGYIVLGPDDVRGFYEIVLIDDEYPNDNYVFELEIIEVGGSAVANDVMQKCTVTIMDDDQKQEVTVGFESSTVDVNEDVGVFELPVIFPNNGLLSDSLSFTVSAENGTAMEGEHFILQKSEVKIYQGELWGVVPIKIIDKQAMEEDRTFNVVITEVVGASPEDTTVAISEDAYICQVTINKVIRQVRFPEPVVTVDEQFKPFGFPVMLTAPVGKDVTVRLLPKAGATAIEGTHYTMDTKELLIKRGETQAEAMITLIDDKLGNPHRFVDFDVEVITEGVELSEEFKTARLIIENEDTSVGFGTEQVNIWMYGTATIPITLEGVRGNRYLVDIKAKEGSDLVENVHYMILTKSVEIGENDSVVYAQVATLNSDLSSFDLPIEIAAVKGLSLGANASIDDDRNNVKVAVFEAAIELDRSEWTIDYFSSEEPSGEGADNGRAIHMIDDDESTFWHSKWAGGADLGPFEIIIDMQKQVAINEVRIVIRNNTSAVDISVSDNKDTWEEIGSVGAGGSVSSSQPKPGRYLKLIVNGVMPDNKFATIKEVYVKGR